MALHPEMTQKHSNKETHTSDLYHRLNLQYKFTPSASDRVKHACGIHATPQQGYKEQ